MADAMRRLGLIVNPQAGRGGQANLEGARKAIERLRPDEIVTGPGALGAGAMIGWSGTVTIKPVSDTGREQTQGVARKIIEQHVDALVIVGGDGTMADVAQVCLAQESPPLIGVGAGSTNVGRLITCRMDHLGTLTPARLRPQSLDSVLVYCNGEFLGLGFNDGVIGFTVVGTVEGRARDIDAAERMKGRSLPGRPRPIGTPRAQVRRIGSGEPVLVAQGEMVGTVIVGFAEPAFFGKAVAGGMCLTTLTGLPAGCLVCDQPLAHVEVDARSALELPPSVSHYVSLDETTRIVVDGIREDAAVCADGNPLWLLSERDQAEFRIRRAAVTAMRLLE